jgi:hypothetical protein
MNSIHVTLRPWYTHSFPHGPINHIDTKAKCPHLKNLTLLPAEAPSPPVTPYPPPPPRLHTVYVNTVYLFTQGRGGRGRDEPERRLERQ